MLEKVGTVEGRIEFDAVNRLQLMDSSFTLTPVQDIIDKAMALVQPNGKPSCSLKGSECVEAPFSPRRRSCRLKTDFGYILK